MKDFLGNDLAIGDVVVIVRPHYRELCLARVDGASPSGKTLYLTYRATFTDKYHLASVKQTPAQVIKYFGDGNKWDQ